MLYRIVFGRVTGVAATPPEGMNRASDLHAHSNTARLTAERVRFGPFELNVRTGEVTLFQIVEGSEPARKLLLREQSLQILKLLIERNGRIVTREEIRQRLWPGGTFVDFERSINVAIARLRSALADSAESPQYIETVARRGYRLLVSVDWQHDSGGEAERTAVRHTAHSLIGAKINQFRVLEIIGGGGMGLVYKAEDTRLGRFVALKFLPEEVWEDLLALQRFEREARTTSALSHPNICTIYEVEEYEGQPFIAMEFLEGDTLSHLLAESRDQRIDLPELLDIGLQTCDGLEAAHSRDFIHRDIKPSNLFVTKSGSVKILDFGLAKLAQSAEEQPSHDPGLSSRETASSNSSQAYLWNLTTPGTVMGTIGYMSPEQIRKEKLDVRTDLFSLGLVLYEMATGRRAFEGETPEIVHDAILHREQRSVREIAPNLPRRLHRVISKALEKDRSRRYSSASEMRQDLARARDDIDRGRWRNWPWIAAGILLIVSGLIWLHSRSSVTLSANDTVVLADFDNQTGDSAFTDGLNTALQVALEQTPYMNILRTDKIHEALGVLHLRGDEPVTTDIAALVCKQTNSRTVISSSLRDEGNLFHVTLQAADCKTGHMVARAQMDAENRKGVIRALGKAAFVLRKQLGEPKNLLAQFQKPLEDATSSSPEAVHFLALAYRSHLAGNYHDALLNYEKALEEDSSLALARAGQASANLAIGEDAIGRAGTQKAFELRDRLTAPGRFQVETLYYGDGLGEWEKECEVAKNWVETFPRDVIARINFTVGLEHVGRLDEMLVQAREQARLLPRGLTYKNWLIAAFKSNNLNEAEAVYAEAHAREFVFPDMHRFHAVLAFLTRDQAAMQQEWDWALHNQHGAIPLLLLQAQTEAYYGRFHNVDSIRVQALGISRKLAAAGSTSEARNEMSVFDAVLATYYAEVGYTQQARKLIASAKSDLRPMPLLTSAWASASSGDVEEAKDLADIARKQLSAEPTVSTLCLPITDAAIKLGENNPSAAITLLRPLEPRDLYYSECNDGISSAYIRGLAYLELKQGEQAQLQFRKVLDHPGVVEAFVSGSLAPLQQARSLVLTGDKDGARGYYNTFLDRWKHADPEIPIYRQAKIEYARLH